MFDPPNTYLPLFGQGRRVPLLTWVHHNKVAASLPTKHAERNIVRVFCCQDLKAHAHRHEGLLHAVPVSWLGSAADLCIALGQPGHRIHNAAAVVHVRNICTHGQCQGGCCRADQIPSVFNILIDR